MLAVTSAIGEILVVPLSVSVSVLAPCDVVVPMIEFASTVPLGGAVKVKPMPSTAPLARLLGIPLSVTAPVALSYVAVTPAGSDGKLTVPSPGVSVRPYVTPAAADGPALEHVTEPLAVEPAAADGGIDTLVVTSATGEMLVGPLP